MSLIMDGVRWGVDAPMQIRIAANLERLDSRIRAWAPPSRSCSRRACTTSTRGCAASTSASRPTAPARSSSSRPTSSARGGTDKPDNPNEKRIIGDQSSPHPEQDVRERNEPHGKPDGPAHRQPERHDGASTRHRRRGDSRSTRSATRCPSPSPSQGRGRATTTRRS